MDKEKYNQIIDDVYKKYIDKYIGYDDIPIKEVFIHEIKTNPNFSEKWGLKIDEKILTRDERIDLYCKEYTNGIRDKYEPPYDDFIDAKLKTRNIPTKLITITYNENIIEFYE